MERIMTIASVALIGLGEVGQILAIDLAKAGISRIAAYDILFSDPASLPSRAQVPAEKCATIGDAVTGMDLVISAVTAASDQAAAEAAAPFLKPGAFFLDVNSVSPGQKQAGARTVNGKGGRYVEAAVMTPFPPKRIASPILLGGPHAAAFLDAAGGLGFSAKLFSDRYGQASATKMCRSVMIKGIEALLAESLLTARHYGVDATVLASLSDLLPVGDWNRLAAYMISRSLEHGKRRAEEMREVAQTVAEAGIAPLMTKACVERQDWAAHYKDAMASDLDTMLDAVLAQAVSHKTIA
jgi:3-hydroxyisobutyrate dehydrogenase-like beta-hydroxyacid dehydrogenase